MSAFGDMGCRAESFLVSRTTPQKNSSKKWHIFNHRKTAIETPRFTTQNTTTSPQKTTF
jgi:hypothetical protein